MYIFVGTAYRHPFVAIYVTYGVGCRGCQPLLGLNVLVWLSEDGQWPSLLIDQIDLRASTARQQGFDLIYYPKYGIIKK